MNTKVVKTFMFKSKQNQISGKIHFKWEEVKWRKVSARTTHNILKFLYKAEKKQTPNIKITFWKILYPRSKT